MKRVGVNILIVIMILVGSLLPFNINTINGEAVGGDSPIIGVNIKVIGYDFERVYDAFYPVAQVTTQENEKYIWRCTNFNSTSNACLQWANDYSSGNIPGETQLNFTYMANPVSLLDVNYAKYTYEYEFVLDNYYVGYVTMQTNYTYDHESALPHKYRQYFVNGTSFTVSGTAWTNSWTVQSYNLTKIDWNNVPQDIEDIENYLIDIGSYTDDIEQLLNDIKTINTDIFNQKQWYFPIESLGAIIPYFNKNYEQVGINRLNDYSYPIFNLHTNDTLFSTYSSVANKKVVFIFGMFGANLSNASNITNFFDITGLTTYEYKNLGIIFNNNGNGTYGRLLKLTFDITTLSTYINVKCKRDMTIMPIFLARFPNYDAVYDNLSTDFALNFGLSNRLLDNLDLLANGNTTSNNTINNADNTNQQAQQIFNQEEQLIQNAEDDLQDKLDDLDIANKNNNLWTESKFVASANWVKQQFDYLTNNNAFNYMITFSLVIGISLVIIGKLRG